MHGLAVYVKQVLVFACDLSLGVSKDSYLVFDGFTSFNVLRFFFYQSQSSCLCSNFGAVPSNIGWVLSVNPSANVFLVSIAMANLFW